MRTAAFYITQGSPSGFASDSRAIVTLNGIRLHKASNIYAINAAEAGDGETRERVDKVHPCVCVGGGSGILTLLFHSQ